MVLRCAVIGNPIAHSLSPMIHHAFAQQMDLPLLYEKIQGDEIRFEHEVVTFFKEGGKGLNVTLPFKQRAFALATQHTTRSVRAGAANTLWYAQDSLVADNTDGVGLLADLLRYQSLLNTRILILGAGGAARGIIYPLLESNPELLVITNRSDEPLRRLKREIKSIHTINLNELSGEFDLIVNATSAGVQGEKLTLPPILFKNKPFCYDLSYAYKGQTPFVDYVKQYQCNAVDGLGMLVEQAAESFYLWHGSKPDTQPVLNSLRFP